MDLNPYPSGWTLENGPFELADYCLSQNTNTLLLCNAWLDSGGSEEDDTDYQTVRYWAARLRPLWDSGNNSSHDANSELSAKRDIPVIICNRTGAEEGKYDWPNPRN